VVGTTDRSVVKVATWRARLEATLVLYGCFCLGAVVPAFLGPGQAVGSALVFLLTGWLLVRIWRMTLRIDDDGMTIRNPLRTHHLNWCEINHVTDHTYNNGESTVRWRVVVILSDGHQIQAWATRQSHSVPELVAAISTVAVSHGVRTVPDPYQGKPRGRFAWMGLQRAVSRLRKPSPDAVAPDPEAVSPRRALRGSVHASISYKDHAKPDEDVTDE
jgi:Bacterial PH domain